MKTNEWGFVVITDYQGNVLVQADLPLTKTCDFYGDTSSQCADKGYGDWGGAMAAPTIANIDATPDYELICVTWGSGIVTFTIPGSSNARILWGTGRGNYQRSGGLLPPVGKGPTPSPSSAATLRNPLSSIGQFVQLVVGLFM